MTSAVDIFFLLTSFLLATCRGAVMNPIIPDEQRLYEHIMSRYLKMVRPLINGSMPLEVLFSIRLNQIVNLNERQQVLTTNVFIDQTWTDPALSWDPVEYKNVRSLRIPADQIWKPDTFIYNNADNGSTGFIHGAYIQIRHTGEVNWPVPVRLRSSCVVKITYFPFDYQFCMVRFGSWIYSHKLVDYSVRKDVVNVDLSTYIKNSEWDLLSMKLEKSVANRSRGLGLHPHITAILYLKRNTFYYLFNIIVPCVMLSMLTLMTFWLSPTSGEKVTLGLSVFLAFSMFMLLIAEEVPASSDAVPLIGIYLCVVMTMTSLSVICAVLVTNLHNRGSKLRPAPRWLASLCIKYLALPFRVSQDIQLLATTIYLSDYCKYFILHDSRCTVSGSSEGDEDTSTPHQPNDSVRYPAYHQSTTRNLRPYSYTQNLRDSRLLYHNRRGVLHESTPEEDENIEVNDPQSSSPLLKKAPNSPAPRLYTQSSPQDHSSMLTFCSGDCDQQETALDAYSLGSSTANDLLLTDMSQNKSFTSDLQTPSSQSSLHADSFFKTMSDHSMPQHAAHFNQSADSCETDEEDVWVLREDFIPDQEHTTQTACKCQHKDDPLEKIINQSPKTNLNPILSSRNTSPARHPRKRQYAYEQKREDTHKENPRIVLKRARIMIAEWCTIAKVVDRCLFLLSFVATVLAYVFLLIVIPAEYDIKRENVTFANSINTGQYRWN